MIVFDVWRERDVDGMRASIGTGGGTGTGTDVAGATMACVSNDVGKAVAVWTHPENYLRRSWLDSRM